jgi:GNAT superfamily N-acetyltransferase
VPARDDAELIAASHENFIGSYRKLVEHCARGEVRESGSVFTFASGLPLSLFNGCIVTGPAEPGEVAAALEWLAARDLPFRGWLAPELVAALREAFGGHGLALEPEPYPGMVLNPTRAAPAPADGVEVARVDDAAGLDEFVQVSVEGGAPADLARRLTPPSFASDPAVQLFVGRLDGRAVGTSIAIQSASASGIVAVGTLPDARRRGVGAAVSWAAVAAGVEQGHDTIVLQSSPMGYSVYAAMGFRTVVPYAAFSRASATIR